MTSELDRNSAEPLFAQLAQILRAAVADGTYPVRLPSEPDLVAQFGVSRETIRRAVRILVAEGVLRVSTGKGTFVVPPG